MNDTINYSPEDIVKAAEKNQKLVLLKIDFKKRSAIIYKKITIFFSTNGEKICLTIFFSLVSSIIFCTLSFFLPRLFIHLLAPPKPVAPIGKKNFFVKIIKGFGKIIKNSAYIVFQNATRNVLSTVSHLCINVITSRIPFLRFFQNNSVGSSTSHVFHIRSFYYSHNTHFRNN